MRSFVIVTYWWDGVCTNSSYNHISMRAQTPATYEELVQRLRKRCTQLGFAFDALRVKSPEYQLGISLKPMVIEHMLHKWKRPVLYVDCDIHIHKVPVMIEDAVDSFDFMAFNWYADQRAVPISSTTPITFDWHTLFSSGGVLFFGTSVNARYLLCLWKLVVLVNMKKADDRVLDMCFKMLQTVFLKHTVKYYWLPIEYCYIPRYMRRIPVRNIVISHPFSLSNNLTNRLPVGYMRCVRCTDDYTNVVEYIPKRKKHWLRFIHDRNKHLRLNYNVVFT